MAVQYTINKFNESNRGKLRVRLQVFDDLGSTEIAANVANEITRDSRIIGVVGPTLSSTVISSMPFFAANNLSVVSPSAVREDISSVTDSRNSFSLKNFHRVVGTDKNQASSLLELSKAGITNAKTLVVHHETTYSYGIASRMRSLDASEVVAFEVTPESTTNWTSVMERVNREGFNSVVYIGYFPQASVFIRQLTDLGYKGVITLSDGSLSPTLLSNLPKKSLEGVRLTGLTTPLQLVNNKVFSDIFGKGTVGAGLYASEAIDATGVLLQCIKNGSTTKSKINSCLNNYSGRSVTGKMIQFSPSGDLLGDPIPRFVVRDGKFELFREKGR